MENDRTDLLELDNLILNCVNSDQYLRPTALEVLEKI